MSETEDPCSAFTRAPMDGPNLTSETLTVWSCPACAFTFDAAHEDVGGGWSCPLCALVEAEAENARLRAVVEAARRWRRLEDVAPSHPTTREELRREAAADDALVELHEALDALDVSGEATDG